MKNKILIVCIVLIVVFTLGIHILFNNSFAEQTVTAFELNTVETKVGDEVNIELILKNEKAFLALDFVVTYDNTKLDYISYEQGNIQNFIICANESSEGTIKIAGIQNEGELQTVGKNTSVIVLKFNVISGTGTKSNIDLQCDSLYTSETEKAETIETGSQVSILNTSGISGNIITETGYENSYAYLYNQATDVLVDESIIDTNGKYELAAISVGQYYIKIQKFGYLDYYIKGIEITDINNSVRTLNNVELIGGDLNNDGEIEIMDLVKINDNFKNTTINKQTLLNNYTKKSIEINVSNLGYQTL